MRVIVVGAGPGGATAAFHLASAGADVWLVERSRWPRDKTCGDGISPLGVREADAMAMHVEGALRLERALVTTPRGRAFRGGWPTDAPWGTTIKRRAFDAMLVDAAVGAGAHFLAATSVRRIDRSRDAVVATLSSDDMERTMSADVAVVAEGATGNLALRLGFRAYRSRLVAVRGYVETTHRLTPEYGIFYDSIVSPGYGWVFPMDDQTANVGIVLDDEMLRRRGANIRNLFNRWMDESPFARESLGKRPTVHEVTGGIIPTGRLRTAPGVFLVGDAAGVADPFTAEGIFQAMHSARLAARALTSSTDVAAAAIRYEREAAIFDRNERAARGLRKTFSAAIEICARHAIASASFADHLNTAVFFPKESFVGFIAGLMGAW